MCFHEKIKGDNIILICVAMSLTKMRTRGGFCAVALCRRDHINFNVKIENKIKNKKPKGCFN